MRLLFCSSRGVGGREQASCLPSEGLASKLQELSVRSTGECSNTCGGHVPLREQEGERGDEHSRSLVALRAEATLRVSRELREGGRKTPVDAPHICLVVLLTTWKTKTITHDGLLCC